MVVGFFNSSILKRTLLREFPMARREVKPHKCKGKFGSLNQIGDEERELNEG